MDISPYGGSAGRAKLAQSVALQTSPSNPISGRLRNAD